MACRSFIAAVAEQGQTTRDNAPVIVDHVGSRREKQGRVVMSKEQNRGNREAKKPKKEKPKVIAAAPRRLGQLSTDPKK